MSLPVQEASIVLNGSNLNHAQSMFMRVALESFMSSLDDPNALGEDETGRKIRQLYLDCGYEIRKILYSGVR